MLRAFGNNERRRQKTGHFRHFFLTLLALSTLALGVVHRTLPGGTPTPHPFSS